MLTRYTSSAEMPATLPVFPLAGAILLPRSELPLNIFEPRYLKMIDDSLRGSRLIGIIQPTGEGGMTGSPQGRSAELARVGCVGRLTSYQELPDGRLLIVLTGVARFSPREELSSTTPYRIFAASYDTFSIDFTPGDGEDLVDREKLLDTLKRFLDARQASADWKRIQQTGSEQLVNWLSLASPFQPKEKQALLEAPTLKARAEMLITLAEMDLAGTGSDGSNTRLQ